MRRETSNVVGVLEEYQERTYERRRKIPDEMTHQARGVLVN